MISACTFGTLLAHPASPLAHWGSPLARRAAMGVLMGLTLVAIVYSRWGMRSGAHLNPALTLTFLRLGKIAPRDAAAYVAAQFAGGALGVLVASLILGAPLADPAVRYVATAPGAAGAAGAFVAEAAISAVLVAVVLLLSASRWRRWTGVTAAALVALYITIESPISGMSMNPARTTASALFAGSWTAAWVYFAAPLLGMLLGAELARLVAARRGTRMGCAHLNHPDGGGCRFCDWESGRTGEEGSARA
jgi:aquaporin Z